MCKLVCYPLRGNSTKSCSLKMPLSLSIEAHYLVIARSEGFFNK